MPVHPFYEVEAKTSKKVETEANLGKQLKQRPQNQTLKTVVQLIKA